MSSAETGSASSRPGMKSGYVHGDQRLSDIVYVGYVEFYFGTNDSGLVHREPLYFTVS